MSKYTGAPVTIDGTPHDISERFGDLSVMSEALDKLPQSERERIGNIEFTKEAIILNNPSVGNIEFRIVERTDNVIRFDTSGPLPMKLTLFLNAEGVDKTRVASEVEVELPMMLRPLVGPYIQKAADQLGSVLARIATK